MSTDKFKEALAMVVNWERGVDIRPHPLFVGLDKSLIVRDNQLDEVFNSDVSKFMIPGEDQDSIHDRMSISPTSRRSFSLNHYVGSGSIEINEELWKHHMHGDDVSSDTLMHTRHIDESMRNESGLGNIRLFTGIRESPINISSFHWNPTRPKKLIHLPSFTSTSTDFDVAANFTMIDSKTEHHQSDHHGIVEKNARHVLELNLHDRIFSGASVREFGARHEHEILLGRGHNFILHPVPTRVHGGGFIDPIYVWHADINSVRPISKVDFKDK